MSLSISVKHVNARLSEFGLFSLTVADIERLLNEAQGEPSAIELSDGVHTVIRCDICDWKVRDFPTVPQDSETFTHFHIFNSEDALEETGQHVTVAPPSEWWPDEDVPVIVFRDLNDNFFVA